MAEDREVLRIAARIMTHLHAHPNAADSAPGVLGWWLSGEQAQLQTVELALEHLVAQGAMARSELADGTVLYAARVH